jgi:hypothetical protein
VVFFLVLCKNSIWVFQYTLPKRGKTMQFKRVLSIALILSLSFVLVACGGGGGTTSEATEAASGDGGDTGGGDVELAESASATDALGGTVTVGYPTGWTATAMDGAGTVSLTGSEPGQIISVTFLNSTMASALGDSPSAILTAQSDALASAMTGAEIGDVSEVTVGGNPGAMRTITVAGVVTYYYIVEADGGFAFVYGNADQATIEAIAGSVSYAGA